MIAKGKFKPLGLPFSVWIVKQKYPYISGGIVEIRAIIKNSKVSGALIPITSIHHIYLAFVEDILILESNSGLS